VSFVTGKERFQQSKKQAKTQNRSMQKAEFRKHKAEAEAEADSCSALLCCAVLCCAVPVLCSAVLWLCSTLLDSIPRERNTKQKQKQTAVCSAVLCCAVLCCAVLNYGARESKRFTAQEALLDSTPRERNTKQKQKQTAALLCSAEDFTHRKENADMSKKMYFKR
jgi:hypothetical protein